MVAIVIDHGHRLGRNPDGGVDLAAPGDTLEAGQRSADGLDTDTEFEPDRDRGQGILDVVLAREIQHELARGVGKAASHTEVFHTVDMTHVVAAHVGGRGETVGQDPGMDRGDQGSRMLVVRAHAGDAVERQAPEELDEGRLQLGEIAVVGRHVVGVDVGQDGHQGLQQQEGRIALVRFDHDVVTRAEARVRVDAAHQAADDERRVEPAFGQHTRDQARGGGLAMRTGNRDAVAEAHQLREHLGARHARNTPRAPPVIRHCRRARHSVDHHVGTRDVFGAMPEMDIDADVTQVCGHFRSMRVGARDAVAEIASPRRYRSSRRRPHR